MNANRSPRLGQLPLRTALCFAVSLATLSACVPAPQRAPAPLSRPAPLPPPPPPAAPVAATADWRDAPATPGNWSWMREGSASIARFGDGQFTVRCDGPGMPIRLERAGSAGRPVAMTITTTAASRALTAIPIGGDVQTVGASLSSQDPLLDAMAFSRGRFAVDVSGARPLYLPAWPELAHVIEDCR